MERVLYKIVDICQSNRVERTFIQELHQSGLIEIIIESEIEYIEEEQIAQLEKLTTLHYELEVNIQGLEVIQNLLQKIGDLQDEVYHLKRR